MKHSKAQSQAIMNTILFLGFSPKEAHSLGSALKKPISWVQPYRSLFLGFSPKEAHSLGSALKKPIALVQPYRSLYLGFSRVQKSPEFSMT
jgi:hypothetical protein